MTNPTDAKFDTVTIEVTLTKQRVSDLICCALEAGDAATFGIKQTNAPAVLTYQGDPNQVYKHLDYPLNEGGSVILFDRMADEDSEFAHKTFELNLEKLTAGMKVFQEKCPRQFADFMAENDDAETGDCFLQCVVFGEVAYG